MGLLLVCLLAGVEKPAESPVAMVLYSGAGSTRRRDGATTPLGDLDLLYAGDSVASSKEEVRLVMLTNGCGYRILPGKTAAIDKKGCSPALAVEKVERKLSPASLKGLREMARSGKAGGAALRDTPREGESGAVSPAPGGYVLNGTPAFRWPVVKGAVRYEFRLYAGEGDDRKLLWTMSTKEAALLYPKKLEALPAGVSRTWDVIAFLADGTEQSAVTGSGFTVASADEGKYLLELVKLAKADQFDALLAATLFEQAGAYDEAFDLYQKAAKQRPNEPNLLQVHRHHIRMGDKAGAETLQKRLEKLGVKVERK